MELEIRAARGQERSRRLLLPLALIERVPVASRHGGLAGIGYQLLHRSGLLSIEVGI
jgi:hypothetical protein